MNLGIFDLVGVIMLVLAGTSSIYLLRVKNISSSTSILFWFFLCVILSSIATIITNIGTVWDWAFAPSQDAFLILGGVFLVRFAYLYPSNDQPGESRWVVSFFLGIALLALGYAVSFAIRYIANLPEDIEENQIFYLLTPIMISISVLIFFRRSVHWSIQTTHPDIVRRMPNIPAVKYIIKPRNRSALALRNYGLSLSLGLVPAISIIAKLALPGVLASFLFNFGSVIAISGLMLTYFNYAPEPVTISAKLVGVSLVSVLLILGISGVWIYHTIPGIDESSLVTTFIVLVISCSLLIILLFPYFYRAVLLDPLDKLLHGLKVADQGDLNIQVEVQYDDEIGYLAQAFNRMVDSLNVATQEIKNESENLERQVAERTIELSTVNQKLSSENTERKEAQTMLDRQLRYEQALAGCSQSLLVTTDGEDSQVLALNQALSHLQSGANASRAYIFRNIEDDELSLRMGMIAEACAEGVFPQLNNPANQRFPWSQLPKEMFDSLKDGRSYGGPVNRIFVNHPLLMENFLKQEPPLLSIQTFPIYFNDQWWGFIGFDDCKTPSEWDEDEVLMLRTASEMIASTLQRWSAETHLRETLENLEQRVYERTVELTQSNAELRHEILERQRFQNELEDRLLNEKTLANISVRLLSPLELSEAIKETLADLGAIMQSSRVVFIQLPNSSLNTKADVVDWYELKSPPIQNNVEKDIDFSCNWFISLIEDNQKSVYFEDISTHPTFDQDELDMLFECQVEALLLTPLSFENHLVGVIACINPEHPKFKILENIQLIEVVAGLLGSLLHREALLNTLEEKIAERTLELAAFFDMAMLSGEALELSDIMQPALTKLMEISNSDGAIVHLYDEESHVMNMIAQRGIEIRYSANLQLIQLDESATSWIIDRNENVWSSDNTKHPSAFEIPQFQTDTHILLRARGKIQGLLSCYRLSENPFDPFLIFFLSAIAEQLGLAVENYRLRLKAEEVATIQERQRLARELHDAVSQSLYSLTLFARSGRDAYEVGDQAKLLESLEQVEDNSLAALKEMRLLLYQLRSLALEEGGLVQAIQTRFDLVERRSGINASLYIEQGVNLTTHAEQELFRLLTEALNNSLKHSGANQVDVDIRVKNDQIVIKVIDKGNGFVPTHSFSGMGLQNMRQRASSLGGSIDITSQVGIGTQIELALPIDLVQAKDGQGG